LSREQNVINLEEWGTEFQNLRPEIKAQKPEGLSHQPLVPGFNADMYIQ